MYAQRAQRDLFQTYSDWVSSGRTDVNYPQALLFFEQYKVVEQCDASCKSAVTAIETQAYYQYGVALAARGQYVQAVTQFVAAQALLPGSHYAQLAFQAAAPAYYSLGRQQLSSNDCSDALTTYQTLAANYKGTTEAHEASVALAAPVQVTGSFTGYSVTGYIPVVYLSKTANAPASQNAPPGSFNFSQDYSTNLGSSGAYTFTGVAPGNYTLSVIGATSTVWWTNNDNSLYFFPVGPLCTTQVQVLDGSFIS